MAPATPTTFGRASPEEWHGFSHVEQSGAQVTLIKGEPRDVSAMRARKRVERLAKAVEARAPVFAGPPVEVWLPANGRGDRPPGRYPLPGANAVLVIYRPDEVPTRPAGAPDPSPP